jgi:RNA polymerase sigma factor (sigma-70 family)
MSPGIPTRLLATQSDERLLALVRQGHERAFEVIVQRYRKPLLHYCQRLPLPEARAEDILQLALLKTWIAVREGAEVRDLKAWLYRVVHNTAVNAARDATHDGEPLADPARLVAGESNIDLGLTVREALAEVAALPPLQREVIVRTVVAGHSHEQVASDLGITHGAVRGLLYRARTTLRTAATALTPPPLLGWLLGRADQSGAAPARLAELAGGGGTVGLGGLLLKGGAVALTAGVLTTAAIVHVGGAAHHRARRGLLATATPVGAARAGTTSAQPAAGVPPGGLASAGRSRRVAAQWGGRGSRRASDTQVHAGSRSAVRAHPTVTSPRGHRERVGSPVRVRPTAGHGTPSGPAAGSPSPSSGSGQGAGQSGGSGQGSGSGQAGGSGQSGGSSAGQAAPVGSAASSGSGGAGTGSPPAQGAEEGVGAAPGGGQAGSGSGSSSGSGSGSPEGSSSSGQGSSGGSSEPSGGSSGEQSGSLVGTVVHEVGNILEHLLH